MVPIDVYMDRWLWRMSQSAMVDTFALTFRI